MFGWWWWWRGLGDLRWPHWARDVRRGLCWLLRVCGIGEYCSSSGWCGIVAGCAYAEQRGKAQGQRGGWAVMLSKASSRVVYAGLAVRVWCFMGLSDPHRHTINVS